ncbi:MAG: AAA family ATPase, partial [Nitrospiraceae bacterium]
MIIIHDVNNMSTLLPRHLTTEVVRVLRSFPVVVLTGARQTGKSTLIRELLPSSMREYRTLDDIDVLERAERDPEALV